MSLTLRDAQHLSWKTFKKLEKVDNAKSVRIGAISKFLTKAQKLVQLAENTHGLSTEGKRELERQLSEVLFMMLILAERSNINLEDAFLQAVDDIILGFVT